jgi:hypothetical protein
MRCEIIDWREIPIVEVAAEVREQDQRNITLAGVAVRVVDPVRGPLSRRLVADTRR